MDANEFKRNEMLAQPEAADISNAEGNAAKGKNTFQERKEIKLFVLQLQHVLKNNTGKGKGNCTFAYAERLFGIARRLVFNQGNRTYRRAQKR